MDQFMFQSILNQSEFHPEETSYLEITIFDDASKSFINEGVFNTSEEFRAWIHQLHPKAPATAAHSAKVVGSLKIVLQQECDPATFEPRIVTLPQSDYAEMISQLKLSYRMLESTKNVGPFLWSITCQNGEDEHLQLLYRNVQGMKVGHCQGWELSLTYQPKTKTITSFFRGTRKSIIKECIEHLKSSYQDAIYPLLLPMIVLTHDMNWISNTGQQCSREWLHKVEAQLGRPPSDGIAGLAHLTDLEDQLLKIHKDIVAKHPQTQIEVIKVFERTIQESAAFDKPQDLALRKKRQIMNGSITFYKTKLEDLNADVLVTLSRIEILRSAVQNRLAVALADEQRISDKIKHDASMKYSKNQNTFSILGILFLPGTFFAAIFSTTFFDFHQSGDGVVSNDFWVFWVFTIPTMAALVLFLFWDFIYPGSEKFQCLWGWPKRRDRVLLDSEKGKV